MKNVVVALAVHVACLVACDLPLPNSAEQPQVLPAVEGVIVRLAGARAPGPVLVRMMALEIAVDDVITEVPPVVGEFDLGAADPRDLAVIELPTRAERFTITLRFAPDGSVVRDEVAVPLDLRGPPITVVADTEASRAAEQMTIEIDLESSLIDQGARVVFLPLVTVRY
jgi:hypothetical protein